MDNTFENGFMCGLLMSLNENASETGIKNDKIFQYIVLNGIPFATVQVSSHYKAVYIVLDCTGIPQLSGLYSNCRDTKYCNEIIYFSGNSIVTPQDGHPEIYIATSIVISVGVILYKDNNPVWACMSYTDHYCPTVKTAYIQCEEGWQFSQKKEHTKDEINVKVPYYKEYVAWKSVDYQFDKDSIKYVGNYTLQLKNGIYDPYQNLLSSVYLLDSEGNSTSDVTCKYTINQLKYTESYYTRVDKSGNTVKDPTKRPKIELTSTSTREVSKSLSYAQYTASGVYNDRVGRLFTDLDVDSLLQVDLDVVRQINQENWPSNHQPVKMMEWLN